MSHIVGPLILDSFDDDDDDEADFGKIASCVPNKQSLLFAKELLVLLEVFTWGTRVMETNVRLFPAPVCTHDLDTGDFFSEASSNLRDSDVP